MSCISFWSFSNSQNHMKPKIGKFSKVLLSVDKTSLNKAYTAEQGADIDLKIVENKDVFRNSVDFLLKDFIFHKYICKIKFINSIYNQLNTME